MAFPEFDADRKKILFFTRGRGRGHAIPDMEIARELEKLSADVQIRFVSYGTGAKTFEAHDVRHIDLGLPDLNPINETLVLAGKLIGWLDPDLVVAHEEFPAMPMAKIFDKPTVMITDWFTDPEKYSMGALRFADRIVFLDEPGIYEEPEWIKGRVDYVGPVIRDFDYTPEDQPRAREEMGIPPEAFVVAVLPGSWREADTPILDMVLGAFDQLDAEPKHLVWAAGEDRDLIREGTGGRENVTVKGYELQIDRIMVAANVAVTKATRKTLAELNWLGVPSVSISHGQNPLDELRAERYPANTATERPNLTAEGLASLIAIGGAGAFANTTGTGAALQAAKLVLTLICDQT